ILKTKTLRLIFMAFLHVPGSRPRIPGRVFTQPGRGNYRANSGGGHPGWSVVKWGSLYHRWHDAITISMTERDWLASTRTLPMLEFLPEKSGERKLRLFAVACSRRDPRVATPTDGDEWPLGAVEMAESYADLCKESEVEIAWISATNAVRNTAYVIQDEKILADILRDIYEPLPFRRVALNPGLLHWNNGTVPKLAQAIYEERRFEDLPILADAL